MHLNILDGVQPDSYSIITVVHVVHYVRLLVKYLLCTAVVIKTNNNKQAD